MEKKRKAANQDRKPPVKKQRIQSSGILNSLNELQSDEVLLPTSDDSVQWIGPLSTDSPPTYKGFVRSGTYYRLGQGVFMKTDQPEPFIAEIVRLYDGQDGLLRTEARWFYRWDNISTAAQRKIERMRKTKRRNSREIFNSEETDVNALDSIEESVTVLPRNVLGNLNKFCTEKNSFFYNHWYKNGGFFGAKGIMTEEDRKSMKDYEGGDDDDGYNPYAGDSYQPVFAKGPENDEKEKENEESEEDVIAGNYVDVVEKFTDSLKLIRCKPFACLHRQKPKRSHVIEQPFSVTVYENVHLLIDFHAHLVKDEVIGFLGGTWDTATKELVVKAAYPARSCRQGENNVEIDPISQLEVIDKIGEAGLTPIGWYHSHTTFEPDPSLRDIENQTNYQVLFRQEGGQEPFVGAINGTWDVRLPSASSICNWFWVKSTGEETGIPMKIVYTIHPENEVTEHVYKEMKKLVVEYKEDKERMNFKRGWKGRLEGAMKAIHEKEEKEEKEEKGKNEKVVDDAEVKRLLKKNLTEEGKFRYSIRSKLPSRMAEDEKEIALEKIVAQVISNWEQKEDPKQRKKMK